MLKLTGPKTHTPTKKGESSQSPSQKSPSKRTDRGSINQWHADQSSRDISNEEASM